MERQAVYHYNSRRLCGESALAFLKLIVILQVGDIKQKLAQLTDVVPAKQKLVGFKLKGRVPSDDVSPQPSEYCRSKRDYL